MTLFTLLLKSLRHFWRANLAVAAGVAVATAVLVGALLVGDSVRSSLRAMAVQRLGKTDFALVSPTPFPASLADRLARLPEFKEQFDSIVAGFSARGGARMMDETTASSRSVSQVQIFALGDPSNIGPDAIGSRATGGLSAEGTPASVPGQAPKTLADKPPVAQEARTLADKPPVAQEAVALNRWEKVEPGQCVLNSRLADELDVQVGQRVIFEIPRTSDVPLESSLAHRSRNDVMARIGPLTVARIDRSGGFADLFSLTPSQRTPRNAWVNLSDLQREVNRGARIAISPPPPGEGPGEGNSSSSPTFVNLLLVSAKPGAKASVESLEKMLRAATELQDFGLSFRPARDLIPPGLTPATQPIVVPDEMVLQTRFMFLPPAIEAAAHRSGKQAGIHPRKITINLAGIVAWEGSPFAWGHGLSETHYAIIAGDSDLPDWPPGSVFLTTWVGDFLHWTPPMGQPVKNGDMLSFTFYRRTNAGNVADTQADAWAVKDLPLNIWGVERIDIPPDPTLVPNIPGMTDAKSIADWHTPTDIKIDQSLITKADEDYWARYRAAPKLFINLKEARRLWGDPIAGDLTSIRVPTSHADEFVKALRDQLRPAEAGLAFQPIRQQQLDLAGGATDFAELFVSFSFFLIASATLLVALLFRLNVEQRARQIGLLGALGFTGRQLSRLLLVEGAIVAVIGGAIGAAAGVGYCALMMAGLRTWWVAAVGTTALYPYVDFGSLAMGWAIGVVVAIGAILWGARWAGKRQSAALLAGGASIVIERVGKRRNFLLPFLAILFTFGAVALFALSGLKKLDSAVGCLSGGAALLAAMLVGLASWWSRGHAGRVCKPSQVRLSKFAFRSAARRPGRSIATVALLACASFVLVLVGTMQENPAADLADRSSGSGGFGLIVTADVPLTGDLNTPAGRSQVGFNDADLPIWKRVNFMPLRRHAGQDASCLNMTRPASPTMLGVPDAMIERGGFSFAWTKAASPNPWALLREPLANGEIPMIADAAAAEYSLKLAPGDTMTVPDGAGRPVTLRLVATLSNSIFQGELLVSEANFRRLFPSAGGFGTVLVDTPAAEMDKVRRLLQDDLAEMAALVEPAAVRLAAFAQVANTYLATFQTLGSLGLLLGTVGLAVVLIRGLIERRGEMALLGAIGFTPRRRLWLVLIENALLLLIGLAIGAGCALLGALPTILSGQHPVNVGGLLATLAAIGAFGLASLVLAALAVARRFTPADLHAE